MIPRLPGPARDQSPPRVLVADEDPRVVELLTFALTANHFRVTSAADGEAALEVARAERPELVILSARLTRRGGLELCELLRREPNHGDVPILLLSASGDTQARVEALAHGADDFMTKPFSPKELVARAQRLVMRSRDAARHRVRNTELERDLGRLRSEAARAREQADRERTLHVLAGMMPGELLRTLDLDVLDATLLREVCRQTGARSAALLVPGSCASSASSASDGDGVAKLPPHGPEAARRADLVVLAVRGDLYERYTGLVLEPDGGVCTWLQALDRPLHRDELACLSDPPHELGVLAMHGVALVTALRGPAGVEAVVVCEDRPDGAPFSRLERERLAALCTGAAPARATAMRFREHQDRALGLLAARDPRRRAVADEARDRLAPAARQLGVPESECQFLERALELGPWSWSDDGRAALAAFAASDPTRRVKRLCDLVARANTCATQEPGAGRGAGHDAGRDAGHGAAESALAMFAAAGLHYQAHRLSGRSVFESWRTAAGQLGLHADPQLRARFPEATEPAH